MRITSLLVYPVKSARGISVPEVRVTPTGLEGDRHFMIVDAHGRFFTQREEPSLARVWVAMNANGTVTLTSGDRSVEVSCASDPRASLAEVTVWDDTLLAEDTGPEVAELLSRHVGAPLRLVRFGVASRRPLAPRYGAGKSTELADGSPVLVASLASLRLLANTPSITRFRANIVVDGDVPFAEEEAAELVLGEESEPVVLKLVKPCPRCPIVDVDPETGQREKGTLAALARARPPRSAEERAEGEKRVVHFGVDAVVEREGRIRVGDKARFVRG